MKNFYKSSMLLLMFIFTCALVSDAQTYADTWSYSANGTTYDVDFTIECSPDGTSADVTATHTSGTPVGLVPQIQVGAGGPFVTMSGTSPATYTLTGLSACNFEFQLYMAFAGGAAGSGILTPANVPLIETYDGCWSYDGNGTTYDVEFIIACSADGSSADVTLTHTNGTPVGLVPQIQVGMGGPFFNMSGTSPATYTITGLNACDFEFQFYMAFAGGAAPSGFYTPNNIPACTPPTPQTYDGCWSYDGNGTTYDVEFTVACSADGSSADVTLTHTNGTPVGLVPQIQVGIGGPFFNMSGTSPATYTITGLNACDFEFQFYMAFAGGAAPSGFYTPNNIPACPPPTPETYEGCWSYDGNGTTYDVEFTVACSADGSSADVTLTHTNGTPVGLVPQIQVGMGGPFFNMSGTSPATYTITGLNACDFEFQFYMAFAGGAAGSGFYTPNNIPACPPPTPETYEGCWSYSANGTAYYVNFTVECSIDGNSADLTLTHTSGTPVGLVPQVQVGPGGPFYNMNGTSPATYTITGLSDCDFNFQFYMAFAGGAAPSGFYTPANIITLDDPTAVCQDITIELEGDGNVSITGADIDGGSTDGCGGNNVTLSLDQSDFDCSMLGDNTVTLTVSAFGNEVTCSATVTVEDNLDPTPTCQDITVSLDDDGNVSIVPEQVLVVDEYAVVTDGVFAPIDITSGSSTIPLSDDQVSGAVDLGFSFNYYGASYSSIYVSSNGFFTFTPNSNNGCCSGEPMLEADGIGAMVAFCWEDIDPGNGGQPAENVIRYKTVGTAPNRIFVLEFFNVDHFSNGDNITVHTHLYESTGAIEVHTTAQPATCCDHTMGINNPDITAAAWVSGRNAQSWTAFNDYAAFIPVTADNCSGTLELDITDFDCTDLGDNTVTVTITDQSDNVGSCTATVTVEDNTSPISECQDITVFLNDLGEACVTPQEIDGGSTDNCDITLQEIGTLVGPDPSALTVYALQPWNSNDNISSYSYNSTTDELVLDANPHASTGLSSNYALSVNPVDNKVYLLADSDATGERALFEYDIVNGTVIAELGDVVSVNGSDKPNAMEFDDAGNLYVAFGGGGEINTLNISTMTTAAFSQVSYSGAAGLAYDPDGSRLIYASGDDPSINLSAIALGSGTVTNLFDFEIDPGCCTAQGIEYVSGGKLISAGTYGGNTIYTIDLNTQEVTTLLEPTGSYSSIKSLLVYPPTSIELQDPCVEFGCDDLGENEVVLVNTDQSGNASNCTSTVTVVDDVAPDAICEDITVQLDENGEATITVDDVDGGSTDACGIESIEIAGDDEDWNCDEVGENTVVLTLTDVNGNDSTCDATLTVEDNLAPILDCPDIVINLDPGLCGAVVDYDIESTDNCGVATEETVSGPLSGEYLDYHDGPWTVTVDATDVNGNVSTCDFSIVINEYANPTEALACNDLVIVAIDEDGCSIVGADMILEGGPYGCYDDYIVDIDFDGNEVCCDAIGSILAVVVTDPDTGNTCTGSIQPIDAIAPYCSSVTDYTIDCTETIPSSDDTSHPAYPQFYDNCGIESISLVSETTTDSNICTEAGITIERAWTSIDVNGNPASSNCVQTITIERAPLTLPADGEYDCAQYELDDLVPALTGEPMGVADGCMYSYAYSDVVLPSCGSTSKISRTWTILDMCTNEIITHVQIIKLTDTEGPSIDASGMTLNTDSDQCAFTGFIGAPSISDNCSEITSVQMFIEGLTELTYVYDGSGNLIGGYVEGAGMELGTYTLSITATDACGNISTEEVDVTIVDDVTPTAICDEITQVALQSDGTAEVFAETFDDGSHDNCCLEGFDVRRMDGAEFGATVSFDCADIGATTQVVLRVHDCHGNANSCMVEVLVEDKIAPYLAVPAGTEISCEDYFANIAAELDNGNGAILDDMFGVATFGDNCEAILDYSYTYGVDQCGEGSITRSWTVNDPSGNGPVSGTQTITIYHVSDWSISFPGDLDASCVDGELPDFGQPTISGDDCEMIAVSHTDTQYDVVPDACYKIVREWSAINWCTYPDEAAVTATQVIKVTDDEAPIFDVDDFTVQITEADCDVAVTLPTPVVTDCSDDITIETSSDLPAGEAGPGTYTATYTVSDGCGNFSYDVITITVVDGKDPTPYVTDHLVTEIMQTGMTQVINVNDYDIGSFDNCSDVVLSFSPDVTDTEVQFTCDDIGENTLEIWVTDEAGNQDFVTVTMEVQDNMEACGPGSLTVAGALHTSDEQGIEDATVDINGGLFTQVTDETGTFGFDLETGGDYSVVPSLDLNASNGVTTYDIVLVTQHILGINPFTDPLNLIAADANNSNTVTTLDVVAIRMVILQITDAFPNNTSWRFVDKDHVFTDPTNPWDFPEVVNINNLDEEMLDVDFTGIKIGDVNGSAQANFMSPAENRTSDAIQIDAVDKLVQAGQEVTVSFTTEAAVSGYQFTLNHRDLELVSVNGGLAKAEHFGIHNGAITASWNDLDIRNLRGEELFSLTFKALADLQLSEALTINSRYTQAEAYTTQGIEGVELTFSGQLNANYILYQNVPNPAKGHTVIGFDLAKAGQANLSIMTLDGKLVKSISGTFEAGYNEFAIKDLKAAGVLYYSLESGDFTATKKMIIIK